MSASAPSDLQLFSWMSFLQASRRTLVPSSLSTGYTFCFCAVAQTNIPEVRHQPTHTCTRAHRRTHTSLCTRAHTSVDAHAHAHAHGTRTRTHRRTRMRAHHRVDAHARTRTARARALAHASHAHSRRHTCARTRACVCVVTELLSRFVFFLLLGAVPPVPRPLPLWAPGGVARFDPADLPDAPSADESESSPSSSTVTWISSLPCGGGQSGGGGTLAIGRDPSHDPCIGQLRATGLPGLSHDPCIGPLRAAGLPGLSGRVDGAVSLFVRAKRQGGRSGTGIPLC